MGRRQRKRWNWLREAEEWAEKEASGIAYELWLANLEKANPEYNDHAHVFKRSMEKHGAEGEERSEGREEEIRVLRMVTV